MPCCTPYFYYATYSYAYLDQTEANFNYSEKYLDLPLNAFTSLFSIASYSTIFLEIHRNNRNVAQNLGNGTGNQQIRSRKEIAYTFHCLGHIPLFPLRRSCGHFEVFAFTGYFHMTHCTATAITLLFMNREIGSFAKMMLKNGPLAKITSIANVSTIYRHSSDPTGQI
ncbi:hypothetical protein L596_026365 [Steinernema carpocapsae]|uniref:Uncharacterized protein n=1 Tax=Steinernema carpocapsae TaxID=34508 RepID=A0A4U5M150_STECR|nr:hypothetical protein L596_026365 [Steinernema carpocapsae]